MSNLERLSAEELLAECGAFLPSKEVLSVPLLDLNADINLALDLAAPIDLAVAGNANVVLPINAAVSANALSALSVAEAGGSQGVALDQFISGHAVAHGMQTSDIDQTGSGALAGTGAGAAALAPPTDHLDGTGGHSTPPNAVSQVGAEPTQPVPESAQPPVTEATQPPTDATQPASDATQPAAEATQPATASTQPTAESTQPATDATQPAELAAVEPTAADAAQPAAASEPAAAVTAPELDATDASLDGGLLNVNVNVDLDSKLAAPITGAVALNANVAAPINGSVSANVGTIGSQAVAVADQTAIISQQLQDVTAEAVTHQDSHIHQ